MSKHTAEPWSFDKYDNIIAGTETLLLGGIRTPMTAGPRMDEGRANARRIVACVNACAGVDTDLLEAGELDKPTMLVIQENKDLKHRCDELLAALEFVMSAHGEQLDSAFAQAQNAISKAKGV